jgi:hypothetical protein
VLPGIKLLYRSKQISEFRAGTFLSCTEESNNPFPPSQQFTKQKRYIKPTRRKDNVRYPSLCFLSFFSASDSQFPISTMADPGPRQYTVYMPRMTAEQKALYERILAANDLSSVTRAERNIINNDPPPDEEDRLCLAKTGLTMAELRQKALASPESIGGGDGDRLTEMEADILVHGARWDPATRNLGRDATWRSALPADERTLAWRVRIMLIREEDQSVFQAAFRRAQAFRPAKEERARAAREEQRRKQYAAIEAERPRWVREVMDARLERWGFVVFRTSYGGENAERRWSAFRGNYLFTSLAVMDRCWKRAQRLTSGHNPLFVSDSALDGVDVADLRRRFKAMRDSGEIPEGIVRGCFLVADETILSHRLIASPSEYNPKPPGKPDPWETTFFIRAVDPDFITTTIPRVSEEGSSRFSGEILIPLPKTFDWLYYGFFSGKEDWETRYTLVESGPAEQLVSDRYLPASRPYFQRPGRVCGV